jgi:hypothetical protein
MSDEESYKKISKLSKQFIKNIVEASTFLSKEQTTAIELLCIYEVALLNVLCRTSAILSKNLNIDEEYVIRTLQASMNDKLNFQLERVKDEDEGKFIKYRCDETNFKE